MTDNTQQPWMAAFRDTDCGCSGRTCPKYNIFNTVHIRQYGITIMFLPEERLNQRLFPYAFPKAEAAAFPVSSTKCWVLLLRTVPLSPAISFLQVFQRYSRLFTIYSQVEMGGITMSADGISPAASTPEYPEPQGITISAKQVQSQRKVSFFRCRWR